MSLAKDPTILSEPSLFDSLAEASVRAQRVGKLYSARDNFIKSELPIPRDLFVYVPT
jgi:hypothetical protein